MRRFDLICNSAFSTWGPTQSRKYSRRSFFARFNTQLPPRSFRRFSEAAQPPLLGTPVEQKRPSTIRIDASRFFSMWLPNPAVLLEFACQTPAPAAPPPNPPPYQTTTGQITLCAVKRRLSTACGSLPRNGLVPVGNHQSGVEVTKPLKPYAEESHYRDSVSMQAVGLG